jgi:hypothetical protein
VLASTDASSSVASRDAFRSSGSVTRPASRYRRKSVTDPSPTWTYTKPGNVNATLRVTDPYGAVGSATVTIRPKKK